MLLTSHQKKVIQNSNQSNVSEEDGFDDADYQNMEFEIIGMQKDDVIGIQIHDGDYNINDMPLANPILAKQEQLNSTSEIEKPKRKKIVVRSRIHQFYNSDGHQNKIRQSFHQSQTSVSVYKHVNLNISTQRIKKAYSKFNNIGEQNQSDQTKYQIWQTSSQTKKLRILPKLVSQQEGINSMLSYLNICRGKEEANSFYIDNVALRLTDNYSSSNSIQFPKATLFQEKIRLRQKLYGLKINNLKKETPILIFVKGINLHLTVIEEIFYSHPTKI